MSLLQWGDFLLHSGGRSWWRIDCDSFTDSETQLLAKLVIEKVGTIHIVLCPDSHPGSAAVKLKEAIRSQCPAQNVPESTPWQVLIVDDVLTTGASMEEVRLKHIEKDKEQGRGPRLGYEYKGCVIFARGPCPNWVEALFTVNA